MQKIRLAHFYLGVFFAPLIVFYAFTGALQVFKLHEAYRAIPGSPGNWVAWFGQFHKEQAWIAPRVATPAKAATAAGPPRDEPNPWLRPMKWLVATMGLALAATTCLGVYIAFNYPRRRKGCSIALAAGVVLPLLLMAF